MWEAIISSLGSVSGKKILDVGAGYCDLAIFSANAGARVTAIERVAFIARDARERVQAAGVGDRITIVEQDLEEYLRLVRHGFDIIYCTSVLPYLVYPDGALYNMSKISPTTIVECQYMGDGPGFEYIANDNHMLRYLSRIWPAVTRIGETVLDIRPATRTIWRCDVA